MAMKEYNGENPINARININYSGKKPKVSFKYPIPEKDKPMRGSMFSIILLFWMIFGVLLFIAFHYGMEFNSYEYTYGKTNLQEYTECAARYHYITLSNYSGVRKHICKEYLNEKVALLKTFKFTVLWLLLFYLVPIIIYLPFKKKWNKLYPDSQAFLARKKIRIFNKEDIIKKDGNIYVELPVFNNVVCDFNATEDFSKYLKEFDIREHKFHYLKKRKIGKRKMRKYNEFIWYARWYFTEEPKKGKIEVIYK